MIGKFFKIDPDINRKLKMLAAHTGMSEKQVITKAIEYLYEVNKKDIGEKNE